MSVAVASPWGWRVSAAALCCACVLACTAGPAPPALRSPWQAPVANVVHDGAVNCARSIEPFTGPMRFTSKYSGSDAARDQLNRAARQAYESAVRPIRELEKTAVQLANRYVQTGDPRYRQCASELLRSWALASALLDPEANGMGVAVRKWALAAVAAAALQISDTEHPLDPLTRAWIEQLAARVMADYDARAVDKHNNHNDWAAWAVAVAAVVLNDRDAYGWSLGQWERSMGLVRDGLLPRELARRSRALEYHNYALQPLYMLAELACAQGDDNLLTDPRLGMLIRQTARGLTQPDWFSEQAGSPQNLDKVYTASNMAWWARYAERSGVYPAGLQKHAPARPRATRLGGDMQFLRPAAACSAPE